MARPNNGPFGAACGVCAIMPQKSLRQFKCSRAANDRLRVGRICAARTTASRRWHRSGIASRSSPSCWTAGRRPTCSDRCVPRRASAGRSATIAFSLASSDGPGARSNRPSVGRSRPNPKAVDARYPDRSDVIKCTGMDTTAAERRDDATAGYRKLHTACTCFVRIDQLFTCAEWRLLFSM